MKENNNVIASIGIIMFVMFIAIITNISMDLRSFGLDSAKTKAELVAQSVKNGLTAHMVNGIMDKREFFLKQTKSLDNIDDVWIVRATNVEKQYGKSNESPRDIIDNDVINNGNIIEEINENLLGHSSYRITIPYKAEQTNSIDCLSCHNANIGDTLGAISIIITIDDLKQTSIKIIGVTSIIIFLLLIIIIFYIRFVTNPYLKIFSSIKYVMNRAKYGDFSARIESVNSGDAKEVASWINEHMSKLQNSLASIEDKIDVFLTAHKSENVSDPILDVEQTVTRLADIYRFRKTIEMDEYIEDVYKRFAIVLENKFDIYDFNFLEADTTNKRVEVVYVNKKILCDPISSGCRADRTNTLVDSCQFDGVCEKFNSDKYYLCIPYSISNDLDFILSIVCETIEEQDRIRELLPFIQDYIDSAKPEIVSKKLMQILEKNAQTDPMTGLYNRKFLEKYIDNTLYKGSMKDTACGIMMVDIDFFKLINDNYGHDVGDIAIKTISNTLTDVVNEEDVVIRFGGEEFIVIQVNATKDSLIKKAQEIRIAFSQQQIPANGEVFSKTVSIGVSLFPNKDKDFWKYVKQSDIALYEAKQTGRNKVVQYDKEMNK